MKKWILLAAFSLISAAWLGVPAIVRATLTGVHTVSPEMGYYNLYLNTSGSVEFLENEAVYAKLPVLAGDVLVKEGEMVEKGQAIATIDKMKIYQAIQAGDLASLDFSSLLGSGDAVVSAISALGQSLSVESMVNAYTSIPSVIKAPADGIVTQLGISEETLSNPLSPLVSVSPSDALAVRVSVSEDNIGKIALGQSAVVTGVGFPGQEYRGHVVEISPVARKSYSATSQNTVVDVLIGIDQPDGALKSGFSARAQVFTKEAAPMLVIPYSAVLQDEENREYVYLLENTRAVKRVVVTGEEVEAGIEVTEGLCETDRVIAEPSLVGREGELLLHLGNIEGGAGQ